MADATHDAIVLGGGPGGYVCAIRLAQLGQKVACVEEEEYGGVCLNWGCIPSKVIITNAELFEKVKGAAEVGISVGEVRLEAERLQTHKDAIVKKLTGGVRRLLRTNGAEIVEGRGRLTGARTVEVTGRSGARRTLFAGKAVVVATGSSTVEAPGYPFDGRRIIGAREAVSLKEIPRRLCVLGGGVIGLELGMAYQKLGSELTVIELLPTLLPGIDDECSSIVDRRIRKLGGTVLTGARATGCADGPGGSLRVEVAAAAGARSIECDVLLVAVGMRPRSWGIGLEELGVAIDEKGFVRTDERGRTSVPGVYAIGDVSGAPMLAHKASKEGEVVAEVIAGRASAKDWVTVPSIIFTDPEIASVGVTAEAAQAQGMEVRVGKFPFSALGRAMSLRATEGFVKVVTDAATDRVVGVHLVGPAASDLVSEAALALEMVATAEDLARTVHPHPTLGEALMEASAAALGRAIHVANR